MTAIRLTGETGLRILEHIKRVILVVVLCYHIYCEFLSSCTFAVDDECPLYWGTTGKEEGEGRIRGESK